MPVVVLLAVLCCIGLLVAAAGARGVDLPERVAAFVARRLPGERDDWGRAMVAALGATLAARLRPTGAPPA